MVAEGKKVYANKGGTKNCENGENIINFRNFNYFKNK
jgi:hypothetical protein